MVSHRQWWFTVLFYGIFAVTFVGISLLAYHDRRIRDFAGYMSGAVGGATVTLFLMIAWRAWRGRGSLVSQRRLRLLSPAGVPFYLFNLMVSYGTAAVEAQQPMSDPKRRHRLYVQREQFRDTLKAMEQWNAERVGTVPRDLSILVDSVLVASQYQLDDRYVHALVILANEPNARDTVLPLPSSP